MIRSPCYLFYNLALSQPHVRNAISRLAHMTEFRMHEEVLSAWIWSGTQKNVETSWKSEGLVVWNEDGILACRIPYFPRTTRITYPPWPLVLWFPWFRTNFYTNLYRSFYVLISSVHSYSSLICFSFYSYSSLSSIQTLIKQQFWFSRVSRPVYDHFTLAKSRIHSWRDLYMIISLSKKDLYISFSLLGLAYFDLGFLMISNTQVYKT